MAAAWLGPWPPELDGYAATSAIRSEEAGTGRRHLPIIALTATVLEADRSLSEAAGMDDFLTKPVSPRWPGCWRPGPPGRMRRCHSLSQPAPRRPVRRSEGEPREGE